MASQLVQDYLDKIHVQGEDEEEKSPGRTRFQNHNLLAVRQQHSPLHHHAANNRNYENIVFKKLCGLLQILIVTSLVFPPQPSRKMMSLCVRLSTSSTRWFSTKLQETSSSKTRVSFCARSYGIVDVCPSIRWDTVSVIGSFCHSQSYTLVLFSSIYIQSLLYVPVVTHSRALCMSFITIYSHLHFHGNLLTPWFSLF